MTGTEILLAFVVTPTAALGAAGFLASRLVDHRLALARREYEAAISRVEAAQRATAERASAIERSLLSFGQSAQAAAHSEVLAAVKTVWQATIDIRELVFPILYPYAILTVAERTNPAVLSKMNPIMSREDFDESAYQLRDIDEARAFVSTKLWRDFHIFRAFCLRTALKATDSFPSGRLYPWQDDKHLSRMVSAVLSRDDVEAARAEAFEFDPRNMIYALEAAILRRIHHVVFGDQAIEHSARQVLEVNRLADVVGRAP